MENPTSNKNKLERYSQPRIWSQMETLASQTQSLCLGEDFASQPPNFYLKNLQEEYLNTNHQYMRAFGSAFYVNSIIKFHNNIFGDINASNIIALNGASEGIHTCIMGLVNIGDEVVVFDPCSDLYRPSAFLAGAKVVGLSLRPHQNNSKQQLLKRIQQKGISYSQEDAWTINFAQFQAALNTKTKLVIISNPHTITGKIFSPQQLKRLSTIIKKRPQIIVIEDNSLDRINFTGTTSPKIIFQEEMFERTLSVYSGGTLLQAEGVRAGWVVGPANLIKNVGFMYQNTCFCQYNLVERAVSKSLLDIIQPGNTYIHDLNESLKIKKDILIKQLLSSRYDFDLWIPMGGYYIIADISKITIEQQYLCDGKGLKRPLNQAFCNQMAHSNRVVGIPCHKFYDENDNQNKQRYVIFSFAREQQLLLQVGKRLK